MDDPVPMQVAGRLEDLEHVLPSLFLLKALGLANQLRKRLQAKGDSINISTVLYDNTTHTYILHPHARDVMYNVCVRFDRNIRSALAPPPLPQPTTVDMTETERVLQGGRQPIGVLHPCRCLAQAQHSIEHSTAAVIPAIDLKDLLVQHVEQQRQFTRTIAVRVLVSI